MRGGITNSASGTTPVQTPLSFRSFLPNWQESWLNGTVITSSGEAYRCDLVCDLMHLEGAESLGTYGADFYKGMSAVTKNRYGKGQVYYIGTHMEEQGISTFMDNAISDAGVENVLPDAEGLEIVCRKTGDRRIYFVINWGESVKRIPSSLCQYKDLLSGKVVNEDMMLKKYDVVIVKKEN